MSIGKFRRLPLHIRATLLIPVIPEGTCEFRRLVQFILVGAVYHNALTNCATRVCCACKDETAGVAVMYLTLRISRERHGRKNPLPFPYFAAVTCRQSAPDPPRERGDSQEGGNRRCLPSCAPARRQRTFRSLLKRRLYIIGIGEEKTLEISTQYDIMKKAEISMPCKLMLARRSFFALRHRRGRKNNPS